MSNAPKTASEKQFQEDLVKRLGKYRWKAPEELDGNKHKVTVDTLIANWREELNRLNADQLEGVPLTDGEFRQVMGKVQAISNSYEASKLLAMENSTGKIAGIIRDKNPEVSRKQITLTIFKKVDVGGGESTYKIAREVSTERGNRFDLVLLINGLPLINIELKRADVPLEEAFQQFKRYYEAGEYIYNFMAFSQMMVICSPIDMRYFATPKAKERFNQSFAFRWADAQNNPITKWEAVVDNFLMVPMAHQMVGDYLVIHEAENPEERCHMLMRSYQVYALQAVEMAAFGKDKGAGGIPHGGYVWHTTGSGKTITSFKTALFLSIRAGFDKIVFMVDRRELDTNTSKRFKEYAQYEPVMVDETKSTYALSKKFAKPGIVVTTTFKVYNLVEKLKEAGDERLKEKRIVFIIDEAHRTTMGGMMGTIKEFFFKKGLFFGFTGTPLFDENKVKGMVNADSEVIRTTEKLFGPLLHKYTIDEAIADKNVLGFHVKYINTGEFKGYDDLREKLSEALAADSQEELTSEQAEEMVAGWDELKVEREAEKRRLFAYQDETHIPKVVEHILKNWESQSQERYFNAILTVAYKSRVLAYYKEFKRQQEGRENPIHVAMTVSFGNPNSPDRLPKEFVEEMFADYERFTNVSFTAGDQKRGEDAYYEDLTERGKRGGSGRGDRNIDLIIVADQMLTGWDDKYLNTLYNDRMLELQGLIQAYSRTNRVLGSRKEFGTIINYMRPRESERAVNEALKLYGSGGENSPAYVDTYQVAVQKLKARMEKMRATLTDPTEWQKLEGDEKGKEAFLKAFKSASAQKMKVEQYYEFQWDDESFGITQDMWLNYVGAYKNLRPKTEEPEPEIIGLPGKLKIVGTAEITAAYIIELVGEKTKAVDGIRVIDEESLRIILEKIHQLSNRGEKQQADMLEDFLRDIQEGKVSSEGDADSTYTTWKDKRFQEEVEAFASDWGADADLLMKAVAEYDEANPENIPRVDEIQDSVDYDKALVKHGEMFFDHWLEMSDILPGWLGEMRRGYCR